MNILAGASVCTLCQAGTYYGNYGSLMCPEDLSCFLKLINFVLSDMFHA